MFKLGNSSSSNFKSNRQIPHSRIDDEEQIYKKYELGRKLGQGSFGVVFELKNRETDQKFAMKIINKEKAGCKYAITFENEVLIMKSVTHQNLIRLEEVFESKKKLYLITELCEVGELAKWIKKQGPIPENDSKQIMRQIVDAISYLHKHDIVHRDLKLENILIKEFDPNTEIFFIKVTDFGLSSQRETAGTESMFEDYCGTPLYMAPEIIDNYPYSQLCDVWALGIIMFFLLTSHSPFSAETESRLKDQIRKAEINTQSLSYTGLSPEAKDCLSRMIKVNPAHRITSSELIDHPWFRDKKLDEMPDQQKNVLELMTDFLQEQENYKSSGEINSNYQSKEDEDKNKILKANNLYGEKLDLNENDINKNSNKISNTTSSKSTNPKINSARVGKNEKKNATFNAKIRK